MAAIAIALSFGLVHVDAAVGAEVVRELAWIYTFGPEGARAILSAIASSMITVAGLTFSITMLTLQLASSQFGPRLLRNFMRDRGNQIVLGTFISTFVYCLLVLRTVRGTEGSSFVPHFSVAFGLMLAIASLAVLIYFIHHVASSIRIETVLSELAAEACATIDRLYPERLGREPPDGTDLDRLSAELDRDARAISVSGGGYVQRVDAEALMRTATEHDLLVRVEARPSRFVTERDAVLSAGPRGRVSDEVADALRGALILGAERTPYQDLDFSVRRIVEVAQRSLSPGINDPTTALYCIDRLGQVLGRLAERDPPSPVRLDDEGRPRVLTDVETLGKLACSAFAAVARYGLSDADVAARLIAEIDSLSRRTDAGARASLLALADAIRRESEEQLSLDFDREILRSAGSREGARPL